VKRLQKLEAFFVWFDVPASVSLVLLETPTALAILRATTRGSGFSSRSLLTTLDWIISYPRSLGPCSGALRRDSL